MRLLLILLSIGLSLGCASPTKRDPSDRDGIIRDEERQERHAKWFDAFVDGLIDGRSDDEKKQDEEQAKANADRAEARANDPDRFRSIRGL